MALGKTNPQRQMMINMMYLVLTALLALNVSAEVLKAFALVNKGLEGTNTSFAEKNATVYEQFKKQLDQNQAKVKPFYDKAMTAKEEADAMFGYIQGLKDELVTLGEGWTDPELKETVAKESDTEIGTDYFLNKKKGEELRGKLQAFKDKMESLANNKVVLNNLPLQEPPKKKDQPQLSWSSYYFEGVPLIATITELTKFQNDVRNAESEVSKYLFGQIGAADYKFDKLIPIVAAARPIVLQGQKYEAEIFLGAFDSKQQPKIVVNGQEMKVENGRAKYEVVGSGEGMKDVKGKIIVKDPATGEDKAYDFSTAYQVFTGSAVISATKMNVLYIGLENPIEISVPGFPPDKIVASMSGGSLASAGRPGSFIAKPANNPKIREAVINVSVKTADGSTKQMGTKSYRIKQVPKPKVFLGSKDGGSITRAELKLQSVISAQLENFVFEGLRYNIQNYKFVFAPKGGGRQQMVESVTGTILSPNIKSLLNTAQNGDIIIITDVRASGPTGTVTLPGPVLTVQ